METTTAANVSTTAVPATISFTKDFRISSTKESRIALAKSLLPNYTGPEDKILAVIRGEETPKEIQKAYVKGVSDLAVIAATMIIVPNVLANSSEDLQDFVNSVGTFFAEKTVKACKGSESGFPSTIAYETLLDFFPEEEEPETVDSLTEEEIAFAPEFIKMVCAAKAKSAAAAAVYSAVLFPKRGGELGTLYAVSDVAKLESAHTKVGIVLTNTTNMCAGTTYEAYATKLVNARLATAKRMYKKAAQHIKSQQEMLNVEIFAE